MKVAGHDRDDGNWLKCVKHGVSRIEIEQVLMGEPAVMADPHAGEPWIRAIGRTEAGQSAARCGYVLSAHYMHQKEIDHYERKK